MWQQMNHQSCLVFSLKRGWEFDLRKIFFLFNCEGRKFPHAASQASTCNCYNSYSQVSSPVMIEINKYIKVKWCRAVYSEDILRMSCYGNFSD